jgi:hypothetical protein
VVFIKTANEIANNFDFIVRNGVARLIEDMKKAPKFDPDNKPEYDEKNEYFNEANNICQFSLWQLGLYDLCEKYYAILLANIREYETKNTTNFNKGMVYANLGVSQVAQGKIDEGFANILKANIEDEPYHKRDPSRSVFRLELYSQFENGKAGREGIKDYILKHSQLYQTEETVTIDIAFLSELVSSLDTDSHILFISVIEKIRRHFIVLDDKDNRFTRLQIFLCLQDLCLSIENALKKRNNNTGMMKELLDGLFSTASGRPRVWKPVFDANYGFATSLNETQFENNLKEIFKLTDSEARRLLICCAVRNFSSHNLDVGNDWVFQKVNITSIFDNILSSLLFLHEQGCV